MTTPRSDRARPDRATPWPWRATWASVLVLLAAGLAGCSSGGDGDGNGAGDAPAAASSSTEDPGTAASTGSSPSPSTTPTPTPTPDPAEVLAASAPSGTWKVATVNETDTMRDGRTKRTKQDRRSTWTFHPGPCSDTGCAGSIDSTSGKKYVYKWDGSSMRLKPLRIRNPKKACFDLDTGDMMDIDASAYSNVILYTYDPFVGSASRLAGDVRYKVVHEQFYGDCSAQKDDLMSSAFTLVAKHQRG